MSDQIKNMLIGLFVVAAFGILVFVIMFLHPEVGDEGRKLRVRFADLDKINVGTRVTFSGRPVGEVATIHELEQAELDRIAHKGVIYAYELELLVDSSVNVFNSDTITTRTSGLLGERSVAIIPHPPKKGVTLELVNDKILYAEPVQSVEEALKQFEDVATKIEGAFTEIESTMQRIKDNETIEKFTATIEHVQHITEGLDDPTKWSDVLDNVHALTGDIRKAWPKVDEGITHIASTAENLSALTEDIQEGKGTLGRLIAKDDLYLQLTALLNKGEIIMDDVNHYGLLFHLDKGWQRLRARRLNLLTKLQCPQEFRNFFNDEVCQITTSLSRVTNVLEKSPSLNCGDYQKVFTELLRRVEVLNENLQMYNIQKLDPLVRRTELEECCP